MAITENTTQPARRHDGLTGAQCAARDYAARSHVSRQRALDEARQAEWDIRHGNTPEVPSSWWADYADEVQRQTDLEIRTVGSFVQQTLVTDTRVYEVVAATAKTIRLRRTKDGDRRWRDGLVDQGPYPVTLTEQVPDPDAEVITVRLRRDGTYRPGGPGSYPVAPCRRQDGVPVNTIDYRF